MESTLRQWKVTREVANPLEFCQLRIEMSPGYSTEKKTGRPSRGVITHQGEP